MLAGAAIFAACSTPPSDREPSSDSAAGTPGVTIEEALAVHTDEWMAIDGVEGTGIGLCDDTPCIKIFVSRPPEAFDDTLPEDVDGFPVRLEPTGRIEPR